MGHHDLRKIAEQIAKRRETLDDAFIKPSIASERSALHALSRIIYLLAIRFVRRPGWPGHDVSPFIEETWEIEWYTKYLSAIRELQPLFQQAIAAGELRTRGVLSRAPLPASDFSEWCSLDICKLLDRDALMLAGEGIWVDVEVLPSRIYCSFVELDSWLFSKGVTEAGELQTILHTAMPESAHANTHTRPQGNTASEWQDSARSIADELDSRDAKSGAKDSLVSLGDRVAEKMRERGIFGPQGPLSGGTVKREALQGGKWKRRYGGGSGGNRGS